MTILNKGGDVQSLAGFLVSQVIRTGLQHVADKAFQSEIAVSWLADALADTWVKQGTFKDFEKSLSTLMRPQKKPAVSSQTAPPLSLQEIAP